ncbi:ABC transporter permease [Bacilliculturomica massiliensis]|uniref:ABC transporter permease n=1 Tax=Bacilliculturomica massiliensis TaxID=1917867 RepID=UPI001030FC16|nr:iron export ABC transporter permease subunit FetB [Bacilliculturomica massiliensis]
MIQEISYTQLALAYLFIIAVLLISAHARIGREKEIAAACARMTVQLILVGYVLSFVFSNPHPLLSLIIVACMAAFAVNNVKRRVKSRLSPRLMKIISLSMWASTAVCLLFFVLVVIGIRPWYDPQYFIPICGMILGNSMNGIALGAARLTKGFETMRGEVETALMLGATPKKASRRILQDAFDSALMPTINNMVGMGIVSLPGMMTGQILAGNSPLLATRYQIGVMLAISASVALASILLVEFGCRTFFNKRGQLVTEGN